VVATYRERAIEGLLVRLLGELPAVLIVGPRATGKTTTAARYSATIVHLDQPGEAAAFRADPDAALRGLEEPVLLDEWQVVPEVLGAVKRSVDSDSHPGRFILTGSVRADLDVETWAGTGRLVRIAMYGLTITEQMGKPDSIPLFDRLARGDGLDVPTDPPDLRGYVALACRSGFPEAALELSEGARQRWLDSYLDQLLTRDAMQIDGGRDPDKLRRYFEAFALNSAGIVDDKTLFEAAGINRKTALAYEQLLANLLIVDSLPAWRSNRLKRLVLSPKRYLVDGALLASILRLDVNTVMRDGNLLGRLLDTFAVSQMRAQLEIGETRPRLYHLREREGRHEVDVLGELAGGALVATEIKAGAAPERDDARHLVWLRDEFGDRFTAGVVLHTGPRAYSLDDRIIAAPIATLWS
jgi:predicted AAA+ superfamily ATPase